jgi:hypothetical protein
LKLANDIVSIAYDATRDALLVASGKVGDDSEDLTLM